jgi:putative membrane protein
MRPATLSRYQSGGLLISLGAVLVWSGIGPFDRATWWMEVAPVLIGVPFLVATSRRFPLTPLVTSLLAFFALILMVGGHYTYAEVPLGFWFRDLLDLSRNHYDRLGHLTQGFVPALVAREVLHRCTPLRGGWLGFLSGCVALSTSALYELIEWWAALLGGESADAFLGTQGDVWDTQWDMFLAMCGAAVSLTLLSAVHDRQLQQLEAEPST